MDSLYEDDYYYEEDYDYDYDYDYMVKFMTRRSTQLKRMRQAYDVPHKGNFQRMIRQRKFRDPAKSLRGHAQKIAGVKSYQKKVAKKAAPAPKTMAYVDVWIDKEDASDIVQPVIDGQIEADYMAQDMYYEWGSQW